MKAKQRKKRRATIRREDTVMVISGKDKGRTGRVITVDWKRERLLIEGVNMVTRHTKPNAANQQGGLIKIEAPVHYSNVQLYNPTLERGVRVKIQTSDAGVKNRVCVKSGEVIGYCQRVTTCCRPIIRKLCRCFRRSLNTRTSTKFLLSIK